MHELLIVAEGPRRGRVLHAQPAPAAWGAKEAPPRFAVVASRLPIRLALDECIWDFDAARLIGPGGEPAAAAAESPAVEPPPPENAVAVPVIAVIGIHRTLSSALAEAMELLGVSFGGDHVRGEDRELARLCERVHPFPHLGTSPADLPGRIAAIVARIVAEAGGRPAAIKYPTLSAMLPWLQAACPNVRWVHVARPLEESIQSLIDRSQRPGHCLLYTSPSPRDGLLSRMPSSA